MGCLISFSTEAGRPQDNLIAGTQAITVRRGLAAWLVFSCTYRSLAVIVKPHGLSSHKPSNRIFNQEGDIRRMTSKRKRCLGHSRGVVIEHELPWLPRFHPVWPQTRHWVSLSFSRNINHTRHWIQAPTSVSEIVSLPTITVIFLWPTC